MKQSLSKTIVPILCLMLIVFVFFQYQKWTDSLASFVIHDKEILLPEDTPYKKNSDFTFVQETDNFIPYSKGDIKNIFYTVVNHGWSEFTFYCPNEYKNCLKDMKEISNNQDLLTHINNFVHPYNGFSSVETTLNENGEINLLIHYFYDKNMINDINQRVNQIYNAIIKEDMSTYDKILTIHDYIINHTKYDVERNNDGTSRYNSYLAYGPLIEGLGTCNGYTDAMALFLEKMDIPNFKVARTPDEKTLLEGHVWNALYLNKTWYHLDLTWDDPVSKDGKDYLQHKYFLITTSQLKEADSGEIKVTEHDFKENIYIEMQEKQE